MKTKTSKNKKTPASLTDKAVGSGALLGWLVQNHMRVRLVAMVVILAGLFIGGESESQAVKCVCFALVVPLLTMAQLETGMWRAIFCMKPNV